MKHAIAKNSKTVAMIATMDTVAQSVLFPVSGFRQSLNTLISSETLTFWMSNTEGREREEYVDGAEPFFTYLFDQLT